MSSPWESDTNHTWIHGLPCSYFTHYNGKQMVRNILRFEDFEKSAKKVLKSLTDKDVEVSVQNNSVRGPYAEYYDDETREKVADLYKEDIRTFGYSFEGSKSATVRSI